MSETASSEAIKTEAEKPVSEKSVFPPFPAPKDEDFDDDISEEEKKYYLETFPDINKVSTMRLHCTACDRHLGSAARFETRMRSHPMLRTLMCNTCHSFYNSGEFDKGEDGSELYCRWCGQGGQVYCCSDCPVVFCAKCIKRNLGAPKIKEIENTDDWKCFKCNSECLWFLRATCWALLRYCDLKNKMAYATQDADLRVAYIKECSQDLTECCKNKTKKKTVDAKKKETETGSTKPSCTPSPVPKLPPTIQVKKFASINNEERKKEKKAAKRPVSPKNVYMKNPITVSPSAKIIAPTGGPPPMKKIRMGAPQIINPIRIQSMQNMTRPPPIVGYTRIRPKPPQPQSVLMSNQYNGFNNSRFGNPMFTHTNNLMYSHDAAVNDNINLSLESLTQGLDVGAIGMGSANNNAVVCTPDFPLEPLCEVTEETDDDVQCITPAPAVPAPAPVPTPLTYTKPNPLALIPDNIVQMTENDVTVNQATGGLKFRVDPQTLSSNKMYRLPDGRIFAINANPNMPGGYSATIVAVTDTVSGKITPKQGTYAAKLSAVSSPKSNAPLSSTSTKNNKNSESKKTRRQSSINTASKGKDTEANSSRKCDLKVPVEWYRYNLIDAVDALEYSLSRLQKLKKEATTMFLRTRTVAEMRGLHKKLDQLLSTSSSRFDEIRAHLNKEMKQYLHKKMNSSSNNVSDDEDDDVEILNDSGDTDDPIFIDENSVDGTLNDALAHDSQEVDLTATSEHNESEEKDEEESSNSNKNPLDLCESNVEECNTSDKEIEKKSESNTEEFITPDLETMKNSDSIEKADSENSEKPINGDIDDCQTKSDLEHSSEKSDKQDDLIPDEREEKSRTRKKLLDDENSSYDKTDNIDSDKTPEENVNVNKDKNESVDVHKDNTQDEVNEKENSDRAVHDNADVEMAEDKGQDIDMSEDLIETLLQDDSVTGDFDENSKTDFTEDIQVP